jgi:DNA-binding MarR family transcriptional regulator
MYRTCVEREVTAVDDALLRMRRLWSPDRSGVVDDLGTPVEMSSLLVVEACARAAGTEATIGDVARFADVAHSTASRLVDRAERNGLVRRLPSARARHTAVALTDQGAALRERALRARTGWLRECLRDWTDADVTRLGELLLRFADAVEHGHPGPPGPG